MTIREPQLVPIDSAWQDRVAQAFGPVVARHLHFDDGFSMAMVDLSMGAHSIAGVISTYWRDLPAPLVGLREAYIDVIEVLVEYRRRGFARALVEETIQQARQAGVYQVRAWSSEDKMEAISLWARLGFGMCPTVTYPGGKEVRGYFVTRVLDRNE